MARTSSLTARRSVLKEEQQALRAARQLPDGTQLGIPTSDSFVNFQHKLGMGTDNPMSGGTYGFNPVTRDRLKLEWIHRGSWLGGVAVDVVADDMTRAGIDYLTDMPPEATEAIDKTMTTLALWPSINNVIRWGRLYGGAVGVILIDGQDLATPLRVDTVGPGQFRGILCLDRWQLDPTLEDLVTEYGPMLGTPKYYRVQQNAPALRGKAVHYSRIAVRHCGVELPYNQALTENLWGISILERLYDRMIAFDSATTGAAQLVYKCYLRTLKIKGLREIVASSKSGNNNKAMDGLTSYVDMMRRFQSIEGITMVDSEDDFQVDGHSAFSGLSDALMQFGQQLAGALQIPLTRLFGQSPAGLNATGESDMRMYYDHINDQQQRHLHHGVSLAYKCAAASKGVQLPPGFNIGFKSLWQLSATEKSTIAKDNSATIIGAKDAGLISDQVALRELKQSSRETGVFTNITDDLITLADSMPTAPEPEMMPGSDAGLDGLGAPGVEGENKESGDEVRPDGQAQTVPAGKTSRVVLQRPAEGGGEARGDAGQGVQGEGPRVRRPIARSA